MLLGDPPLIYKNEIHIGFYSSLIEAKIRLEPSYLWKEAASIRPQSPTLVVIFNAERKRGCPRRSFIEKELK